MVELHHGMVGLHVLSVVLIIEVRDIAVHCFVLVLRFEDVQLLHEQLLLVFYLCEVGTELGTVGVSVLGDVLGGEVGVLLPVLAPVYAVSTAVVGL